MRSLGFFMSCFAFAVFVVTAYIPFVLPFEIVDRIVWGVPVGKSLRELRGILFKEEA